MANDRSPSTEALLKSGDGTEHRSILASIHRLLCTLLMLPVHQEEHDEKHEAPAQNRWREMREAFDTVVFVLLLVTLLRMFCAEAFVIPTGSMAPTLLGQHRMLTCPRCGTVSPINYGGGEDSALDGLLGRAASESPHHTSSGTCQNCRFEQNVSHLSTRWGDRVVVAKFMYEGLSDPDRWQVVVFKCPEVGKASINYIKRLVGLPGETLRIHHGDLFVKPQGADDFTIAVKPPRVQMAERRLVWDDTRPASDLAAAGIPERWLPESATTGWKVDADRRTYTAPSGPKNAGTEVPTAWLQYRHILGGPGRQGDGEPQLITDFEAYNSSYDFQSILRSSTKPANWVGDLMVEATIDVPKLEGTVSLELGKGTRRYVCELDLGKGKIRLLLNGVELVSQESPIRRPGSFPVRFSNFDQHLTVWIADRVVIASYAVPPEETEEQGPTLADLAPVRIGVRGVPATVHDLRVFRDTYYTQATLGPDYYAEYPMRPSPSKIAQWRDMLIRKPPRDFEIPEGQYFMMGDNSPCSSDSRDWRKTHFVPREMLLGRAVATYLSRGWMTLNFID